MENITIRLIQKFCRTLILNFHIFNACYWNDNTEQNFKLRINEKLLAHSWAMSKHILI